MKEAIRAAIEALEEVYAGLTLAYDAASKKLNDEALLHIGHNASKLHSALSLLREAGRGGDALSDGFDGSGVRVGPNHSTIEIWYDTEDQALAAHKVISDLIDSAMKEGK